MGDSFSCCIRPSSPDATANFNGPIKRRSCTDCSFLVLFVFVLISLFGLVIYCKMHGDVNRIFYGFDECGNICGFKNEKSSDPKFCIGRDDMSGRPYLQIDAPIYKTADLKYVKRECVASCNPQKYQEFLNRCVPNGNESTIHHILSNLTISNFFLEVTQDLQHAILEIIYLCLFAFVSSLVLMFLIRFVPAIGVWFILLDVMIVNTVGAIYLWVTWKQKSNQVFQDQVVERDVNTYFVFALILTISTIIILLIIVAMRRHFALVVQLFKKAGKAIQNIPLLLVLPMVTLFFLCSAIAIWSHFAVLIQSSGLPAFESKTHNVYYKKDQLMKFARVFNILVLSWVIEFIIDCQHMITAGSVATWFFTRNGDNLSSPILTSISYLFNYHLGSVAFGSLIITVFQIIRAILNYFDKNLKKSENRIVQTVYKMFKWLFNCLVQYIQYLTRNAYIEIAIYGDNFCSSGQQAFKTINSNLLREDTIKSVGYFVLFVGKVLVVTMTVLLAFTLLEEKPGILHLWVPLIVATIFAFIIAHCFISQYEMVIDTIFMCFYEDYNMHDGVTQEYPMSKELKDFVVSSHKGVGDGATN